MASIYHLLISVVAISATIAVALASIYYSNESFVTQYNNGSISLKDRVKGQYPNLPFLTKRQSALYKTKLGLA